MNTALREQMLAHADQVVNLLATWTSDHPEADLEAREATVLEQGRALLQTWLTLVAAAAEPRSSGCPHCGLRSPRPVQRQRGRTVQTRCGLIRLRCLLRTCRGCDRSWLALVRVLRLSPKQRTSAGVLRWEARLGGLTTFAEAAALLAELTGVEVGTETLRTHAEQVGTELEAEQQAAMALVEATQEAPAEPDPAPGMLLVESDGVMVRFRDRHLDGTPVPGNWHEVKLGLVAGWQDAQVCKPSYVGAREHAVRFARRVRTEAARRGALDVLGWRGGGADGGGHEPVLRPVIVLGDGAKWIWDEVAASFGAERIEIVDWYHANQHLWTLAKALHGEGTPATTAWANQAAHLLWKHGPAPLLALLAETTAGTPEVAKVVQTERGYFTTNALRMRYSQFRRHGLPVGSGAVESAAKHLVQQRLKRAGMRWSDCGARAILHLRCASLNNRPLTSTKAA